MILKTENLILTPLSEKELDGNYVNWLNDKEVCKYNSHGERTYTREMAVDFINSVKNDSTKEVYAVYHQKDNIHIGNISLQQIDKRNQSAEIAFLFGEKGYWGKGYASEAAQELLKRAFNELKLHRIYFGTSQYNIGMQKVGEKLGFQKEGTLKDAQFKNGKFNDIVLYGLVNN